MPGGFGNLLQNMKDRIFALASVLGFCLSMATYAHTVGESYLFLSVGQDSVEGSVQALVSDLDELMGLDTSSDGKVSLEEFAGHSEKAKAYVLNKVGIRAEGKELPLKLGEHAFESLPQGQYAVFPFTLEMTPPVPDVLEIDYKMFFEVDPDHRGRVIIESNAKTGEVNNVERVALDFRSGDPAKKLDLTLKYSWGRELLRFIWEGMWHIWIGLDHILFLAALLLPAVLVYGPDGWKPVKGFSTAFWNVVKIVSCFTIAHSITLSLAAFGVVSLSSRLVESVIALSVVAAALYNLCPVFRNFSWIVVFAFGLFHGLGFASVLGELLSGHGLATPLVGFNVGVELGQIAIVLVVFPILFLLRRQIDMYRMCILQAGSIFIALLAGYWFVQRAFGLG